MKKKIFVFDLNYDLYEILNKKCNSEKIIFFKLELDKINEIDKTVDVFFYTNIISELKYYIIIKSKFRNITILSSNTRLIKVLKKLNIDSIKLEEYIKLIIVS